MLVAMWKTHLSNEAVITTRHQSAARTQPRGTSMADADTYKIQYIHFASSRPEDDYSIPHDYMLKI
jgi:hypothetical protein